MEIRFSVQGTGACHICARKHRCEILKETEKVLSEKVKAINDDIMEIVIYRCPEFEESQSVTDSAPFDR